jgi:hypothetical protein
VSVSDVGGAAHGQEASDVGGIDTVEYLAGETATADASRGY